MQNELLKKFEEFFEKNSYPAVLKKISKEIIDRKVENPRQKEFKVSLSAEEMSIFFPKRDSSIENVNKLKRILLEQFDISLIGNFTTGIDYIKFW